MPILLGALTTAGGLFLLLWFRTITGLPASRRPGFVRPAYFRWGVPAAGAALLVMGIFVLVQASPAAALATALVAAAAAGLLIKFDRYSAGMRIMYDDYNRLRRANPCMSDPDVLFYTARRHYPGWSEDRIVELVAGKDIDSLMLLTAISEHGVNPITDWQLYRSMRAKAARIAGCRARSS
jgi:hypothetical protein